MPDAADWAPDASFDGGNLDCGNGLLLLIRRHIDQLAGGSVLELFSTESSVAEDLPAWCRMTGNRLLLATADASRRRYLICKGQDVHRDVAPARAASASLEGGLRPVKVHRLDVLPVPTDAPRIAPLSVMGVGSWPRPRWMLQALHAHLEGRLDEGAFQETADDAVRLVVQEQVAAGVDVFTDGEQRRDSYAAFVGDRLDNVILIPLSDLTAMVDDPEDFARELRALDVPAQEVRHPVPFGPLARHRPIVAHELRYLRTLTERPVKASLPGPYLLTRMLWLDCLTTRAHKTREDLAADVVSVLREELHVLLSEGASLVPFDEPVLTEVVFSGPVSRRSFMCGALSDRGEASSELAFARELLNAVIAGLPVDRTAVHICRGNWTRNEEALLAGDYRPLRPYLDTIRAGTVFLETSTPRAGELEALGTLGEKRVGLGVVNPRSEVVEPEEAIVQRAEEAIRRFGAERLLLNPDCGFATFADNPVASSDIARRKLERMVGASRILRERHGVG